VKYRLNGTSSAGGKFVATVRAGYKRSMRKERSAGVVLFRTEKPPQASPDSSYLPGESQTQAGVIERPVFLLLDYGRHWDFPKGHVEPGETDHEAAIRELFEETGIADAHFVPGFERQVDYYFRSSKHGVVHKTVVFFLAKTDATSVHLSEEHVAFAFESFEAALAKLTFASAKDVIRAAMAFVQAN